MSSGLSPSGVPAGPSNATLRHSAGNDTASLSSFVSVSQSTSLSTFTSNATAIEASPTPSVATVALSEASSTISTSLVPVRATLVKATSDSASSSAAASSTPSSTLIMSLSSSKSASSTAKAVAPVARSNSSAAPAPSSTAAAPSSRVSASATLSANPSSPSASYAATSFLPSSPIPPSSSSSTQNVGAEAPASSPSSATSSVAGTGSSSVTGEKSGPLSVAPSLSPASTIPAPSSDSAAHSASNSNRPLPSGSSTTTSGSSTSQTKSAPTVVQDVPVTTSISIVTEAPQTSFSTPVSIAVTASNGRTTLSAPPLVTSVLPSTRTDGIVVQVTHVIANPNNSLNALDKHSFFDNAGAVAGTFIAVGIVATALAAFLLCSIRRRRRRARRARLEARLPSFPFRDEPTTPQTAERRSVSVVHMNMEDPFAEPPRARPPLLFRSVGSADGHWAEAERRGHTYEGPFADYRSPEHGAFGHHNGSETSRAPSRALSTPSIYPPSLPDDGQDQDSLYEQEVHISPPLRSYPATSVPEYIPLERGNLSRPSTQESNVLRELDTHHPPLLARPPAFTQTPRYGYASSSTDHGSSTDGPQTPRSDSVTAVGSLYLGDEKERVGEANGLQRPASPQSAFLRRQLSKPLAESFSIPAELRRMSVIANDRQDFVVR